MQNETGFAIGKLHEALLEASLDGILFVAADGRIVTFNKRFTDMWGISPDLIQSRSDQRALDSVLAKLADPDSFLRKVKDLYANAVETSRDEILLKDGRVFDRYSAPVPVPGGTTAGRIWFFRDITASKRLETELKRALTDWDRTFDSMPDMVFIQDMDFRIMKCNKAFADAVKMRPEEIIGRKCYELLHKRDSPWPECPFEKTRKDSLCHTQEVNDPAIGLPLLVTTSPMLDDQGKLIGSVHIAKDISGIKKIYMDLEQKVRDLQQFQKITLGRETKMIELKKEIEELKKKTGP